MYPDRSGPDPARPLDDVETDRWEGIVRSLRGDAPAPARQRVQPPRTGPAGRSRSGTLMVEGALLLLFVVILVPDPTRTVLLGVVLLLALPALVIASVWKAADLLERTPDRDDDR